MQSIPEFSQEQMDKVVEEKAKEIYEMFKTAVNDQITDAVTQANPTLAHDIAKSCSIAHIKPFADPLNKVPADMVNGAAKERLTLVQDFWAGVKTYLQSL
jgi:hypothetical protein